MRKTAEYRTHFLPETLSKRRVARGINNLQYIMSKHLVIPPEAEEEMRKLNEQLGNRMPANQHGFAARAVAVVNQSIQ